MVIHLGATIHDLEESGLCYAPLFGSAKVSINIAGMVAARCSLPELRARLGELPRGREVLVICRSGQRAYYATRLLLQSGFKARTLAGGMLSRSHLEAPNAIKV